ncbi:MAG: DUF1499 domain-containing protein [Undibacterium sp.]|nr:DUF1499 domain-containing protein [Undibacterium sp.]
MIKIIKIVALVIFIALPFAIVMAGQLGLLSGNRPTDLGLKNGLLKPPVKEYWNVVSSHAEKQPHTDYHVIAPIKYSGSGKEAFTKLATIVRGMDGANVITQEDTYLYAEFTSKILKFTDDVEFVLDEPAGVIQMRSASRLGRKDLGVNRKRLETIRTQFSA